MGHNMCVSICFTPSTQGSYPCRSKTAGEKPVPSNDHEVRVIGQPKGAEGHGAKHYL